MADKHRTSDKPRAAERPPEIPIDRDARFVRYAADDMFVVSRADDILLSVIEQGPRPVSVRPPSDTTVSGETIGRGQLGLQMSYTEVARIVVEPDAALAMALQVLDRILAMGAANAPDIQRAVDGVVGRHGGGEAEPTRTATR